MRRFGRFLVVPVLLVGLTSCGGDSDESEGSGGSGGSTEKLDRTSRFAVELESMPGVVSADAVVKVGKINGFRKLVVDLVVASTATPPEVAAALGAVAVHDRRLGFRKHHLLVVERDDDDRHPLQYSDRPRVPAIELAQRWELLGERLDPDLPWFLGGDGVVTMELGGDAGPDDVTATAEEIRGDPDLAALPGWSISSEDDEGRYNLATETGMTEDLLESWRRAVANLDLGPAGASLRLTPFTAPPAGPMSFAVEWELRGVRGPGQLTPERWGDRLWPLLRAQLDVLRGLPPSSQFSAANYYRSSDGTRVHDPFLISGVDGPLYEEEPNRGWSAAAARYLAAAEG